MNEELGSISSQSHRALRLTATHKNASDAQQLETVDCGSRPQLLSVVPCSALEVDAEALDTNSLIAHSFQDELREKDWRHLRRQDQAHVLHVGSPRIQQPLGRCPPDGLLLPEVEYCRSAGIGVRDGGPACDHSPKIARVPHNYPPAHKNTVHKIHLLSELRNVRQNENVHCIGGGRQEESEAWRPKFSNRAVPRHVLKFGCIISVLYPGMRRKDCWVAKVDQGRYRNLQQPRVSLLENDDEQHAVIQFRHLRPLW